MRFLSASMKTRSNGPATPGSVSSAGPLMRLDEGTESNRSSTGANSGRVSSWYPPPTS